MCYHCGMKYFLLIFFIACGRSSSTSATPPLERLIVQQAEVDPLKDVELVTPSQDIVRTSLAYKSADIYRGLSGVRPENFADDQAKLFYYFYSDWRTFWMLETYFDLDIIYLDKSLKITDIVRDLPFYTGTSTRRVPRAPETYSRHVLEMKSTSPIAEKLQIGDRLIWKSSLSMQETERRMKRRRWR